MFRRQQDHPHQVQGSGNKTFSHAQSCFNIKPDPFALNDTPPTQRLIDGYLVPSKKTSINSNLSHYFTEGETTSPHQDNFNNGGNCNMASATTMGVDQAAAIHGSQGNHNHNHSHQHGFGFHSQASGYFVAPSRAAPEWTTANFADPSTPETAALAYASAYNIDSDSQRVPVATPPPQGRKAVGIVRGGRANKKGNVRGGNGSQGRDPTKTVSGGIRLRSIYCATSIQQVLEGEFEQHEEEKDMVTRQLQRLDRSSTAVLIEVIGTVCAPVIYEGFCWRFILRDPTVQDYQQKYPQATHVPLLPSTMPDGSPLSLSCQLFDMENNLNLAHLLARGELVRVIGVTPQPQQKPKDQSLEDLDHCPSSQSGEARFLCVSCRKALADEAQLAIEGSNRCPQPKVM